MSPVNLKCPALNYHCTDKLEAFIELTHFCVTIENIKMIRENNIQVNPDNHRHVNTTQTPTTTIMLNRHNTNTRTKNMAI